MSAVYDKISKPLKYFFAIMAVVTVSGCMSGGGYKNMPDTVFTNNPSDMPDIRWQTQDQRKILARESRDTSTDIKWLDSTVNGTVDASAIAAAQNKTGNKDVPATVAATPENKDAAKTAAATPNADGTTAPAQQPTKAAQPPKFKVHLLVPLSGDKSDLGASMLNAAQMALFEVGNSDVELVPVDTGSSPNGAKSAAEKAVKEGSKLILGPVFSQQLEAIKPITASANIPVVSFTNDWKQADKNTYIMGFLPFMQVTRVVQYAQSKGYKTFAGYAPTTEYSDVVLRTMKDALLPGSQYVDEIRYNGKQSDVSGIIQKFVERHKVTNLPENDKSILKSKDEFKLNFDVLMLPVGGEGLRSIMSQFELNDVDANKVHFVGTGLWDDAKLTTFPSMYGAWFAAPDPDVRREFEKSYRDNFGRDPVRIASISYDATALAAVLARRVEGTDKEPYSAENLTNIRGFAGIDGIFRFRDNGLSERGLAVLEIRPNAMQVIDKAPTAFADR